MNSDMDEKTMDRHRSIDLMNDDSTLLSDDQLFGKMASMSSSSRESRKHKKVFFLFNLKLLIVNPCFFLNTIFSFSIAIRSK